MHRTNESPEKNVHPRKRSTHPRKFASPKKYFHPPKRKPHHPPEKNFASPKKFIFIPGKSKLSPSKYFVFPENLSRHWKSFLVPKNELLAFHNKIITLLPKCSLFIFQVQMCNVQINVFCERSHKSHTFSSQNIYLRGS